MQLKKRSLLILIVLYFIIALINLSKIPVAWVDETMLIDPAWNLLKKGIFASKIWPYSDTENAFLAYLPLSSLIYLISIFLFPNTLFFTRLPWFIMLGISAYYLYKSLRNKYTIQSVAALVLVFIFLLDEGISNAMRSGRVEMPIITLLSVCFYLFITKKHVYVQTCFLALLLIAHPSVYPIVLILFLEIILRKQTHLERFIKFIIIMIPPVCYLAFAGFRYELIYEQFVLHGQEHNQNIVTGNVIFLHFFERFLPLYKVQPYIIALNIAIHLFCIYRIIRLKQFSQTVIEWCFLLTSLFWYFTLAPFYRYTPILVLMIFLLLPALYRQVFSFIKSNRFNFIKLNYKQYVVLICILLYISTPFISRNITAWLQNKERDEFAMYQWLDQQLGTTHGKILLIDESVGHFYSMNRDNVDFSLIYSVKKFRYEDYEKVFYLSHRTPSEELPIQSTYGNNFSSKDLNFLPSKKIITYKGIKLYRVESATQMHSLQAGYEL